MISRWRRYLDFGHYSGGRSVETETRLYEWKFQVPVENKSSWNSIGIRSLVLRVKRGNRQQDLIPIELQEPYLRPRQKITMNLFFSSAGGLESSQLTEQPDFEEAFLLVIDTLGKSYSIPMSPMGGYTTNV